MSQPLLAVSQLGRRYGYRRIFRDLEFSVAPSDVLVLVGPNGAGKTTLLRVLAGLLRPSHGAVERHGVIGLVAHHSMLYDALTAVENLRFAARLYGLVDEDRIAALLRQMGLHRWRNQRVGTFSRGMLQRLAIVRALLPSPDILLFDEPMSGLDEPGVGVVLDVMRDHAARGGAIVVVTHQYERIASLATAVGFLVQGTLHGPESTAEQSPQSVTDTYRRLLADA